MPKIRYDEQSQFYNRIVDNIKWYSAQGGKSNSIAQISKRVSIPYSTLYDKMNEPRKLTLEDLFKISKGLKIDLNTLLR